MSWWPEEEHSIKELDQLVEEYEKAKPDRVVSHEAPFTVCGRLFPLAVYPPGPSRTSQALQAMYEVHKPKEWVFGHWHKHRDTGPEDKTRFICLGIGDWIDLKD